MDVKFKNGLCNCAPSKIDDYGSYKWLNPYRLLHIPKLPDALYDLIKAKPLAPTSPATTQAAAK